MTNDQTGYIIEELDIQHIAATVGSLQALIRYDTFEIKLVGHSEPLPIRYESHNLGFIYGRSAQGKRVTIDLRTKTVTISR